MRQLIQRIRNEIPFGLPEEALCGDACQGCSSKLLIYLETELDEWESKLAAGTLPNFADLNRLADKGRKVAQVLHQNGLLDLP
jgi:uncharacterized metal-binding protein YceD (DUF177 family)